MSSELTEDIIVIDDDKSDESNAVPNDGSKSKCGEVYRDHRRGDFTLVCVQCQQTYNDLHSFGVHVRDEHPPPEIETTDPFQGDVLPDDDESHFELHDVRDGMDMSKIMEVVLIEEDAESDGDSSKSANSNSKQSPESSNKFSCYSCDMNFAVFDAYRMHYARYHHDMIADDGSSETSSSVPRVPEEISCKFCFKTFDDSPACDSHIKDAHADKLYSCPVCQKLFKLKSSREVHVNRHVGKRPYKCPHCPKAFASTNCLQNHVNIHLNLKRYACRYCGKAFVVQSNRKRHERIHTKGGTFGCNKCDLKFKEKGQLTIHLRQHRDMENFNCPHCDKTFLCSTILEEHILIMHRNQRPFSSLLEELVAEGDSLLHDVDEDNILSPKIVLLEGNEADSEQHYAKPETEEKIIDEHSVDGVQADSRAVISKQRHGTFCCYSCGTIFMKFESYRAHYRSLHPHMIETDSFKQISFIPKVPNDMLCQYCLKMFNQTTTYHSHMENVHLDKLFTCPYCPKTFINKISRGRHMGTAHEGPAIHTSKVSIQST